MGSSNFISYKDFMLNMDLMRGATKNPDHKKWEKYAPIFYFGKGLRQ